MEGKDENDSISSGSDTKNNYLSDDSDEKPKKNQKNKKKKIRIKLKIKKTKIQFRRSLINQNRKKK